MESGFKLGMLGQAPGMKRGTLAKQAGEGNSPLGGNGNGKRADLEEMGG